MLTQERLKELLHYNPETGLFIWKVTKGSRAHVGDSAGTVLNTGYIHIQIDGKKHLAHRLAWVYEFGEWPTDQIDHISHNRADNRIANLREVTRLENQRNRKRNCNNKSGYAGVHWYRRDKKWEARIRVCGKDLHLGYFNSMDDAITARSLADIKYEFHINHGR